MAASRASTSPGADAIVTGRGVLAVDGDGGRRRGGRESGGSVFARPVKGFVTGEQNVFSEVHVPDSERAPARLGARNAMASGDIVSPSSLRSSSSPTAVA